MNLNKKHREFGENNKYLIFTLIYLFLIFTITIFDANAKETEIIALFNENFHWLTKSGADEFVEKAKEAGFNTIVPCVWHGRGVTWPSKLAPPHEWKNSWEKFDEEPIKYLIEKAHSNNLRVFAWFTVNLVQRDMLENLRIGSSKDNTFNVFNPKFTEFIIALINEVVKRYEIDGINLDYVRTHSICNSKYCVEDYKKKYNRNLIQDYNNLKFSLTAKKNIIEWNTTTIGLIVKKYLSLQEI